MDRLFIGLAFAFGCVALVTFVVSYVVNLADPTRPIPPIVQGLTTLVAGALFGAAFLGRMIKRKNGHNGSGGGEQG